MAGSSASKPGFLNKALTSEKKLRTVLVLLSHGYLPYSVASDSKLLETSRGLGSGVVPPRRAIAASSAREGEKVSTVRRERRKDKLSQKS